MVNEQDIPHLLALLDDPSDTVQEALARAFAALGPALDQHLAQMDQPLNYSQRQRLARLLGDNGRATLREQWPMWYALDGEMERLESALSMLADFQDGVGRLNAPGPMLDALAAKFLLREGEHNALELATFLFQEEGFQGVESPHYYRPRNSNLAYVLEEREGLPITLACIYLLLGARLGYDIEGCNWPGHFLAAIQHENRRLLIDCYHQGRCIEEEDFLRMQGPSKDAARAVVDTSVSAEMIIARILNNLIRAYDLEEHWQNRQLMVELLQEVERQFLASQSG